MPKLTLFSGLGGDGRFFTKLPALLAARLPGLDLSTPPYPDPRPDESLAGFAARLADLHGLDGDSFVGGASFGGMLAQEIAAAGRARAVFLIGTATHPAQVRLLPRLAYWCCRPLPDGMIRAGRRVIRLQLMLEPGIDAYDRDTFMTMARACGVTLLRQGARMIFSWNGRVPGELKCPWYRVHGSRDTMIRRPGADERTTLIQGGGHLLPMGHAEATADWLAENLRKAGAV